MSMAERIESKLTEALRPARLEILTEELEERVHALQLKTLTPEEAAR